MSRYSRMQATRPRSTLVALLLALGATAAIAIATPAMAQDQEAPAADKPPAAEKPPADLKKRHHTGVKKPAEAPPPAAAAPSTDTPKAAEAAPDPMVQQLAKAGVKTCLPTLAELGKKTLPGVTGYARAANWQTKTPDDRLASVILGQSYPDQAPLPHAFAMLFGAPAGKTKCDGYSIQVIPTKEKCSAIQTKITIRGKKLGDLSGIPFLNDVNGAQVLLLPSAGDGCVLVGVRIDYAE